MEAIGQYGNYIIMFFLAMAWYANWSKRDKIFCTYTNVAKQEREKWVKIQAQFVIFDQKKFRLRPDRVKYIWWNRGLIYEFFPQRVPKVEFTWDSDEARDPNQSVITLDTPENHYHRKQVERYQDFHQGMEHQAGGKPKLLQGWGIWILLGAGLLIAYITWMNYQNIGAIQNYLKILPPPK